MSFPISPINYQVYSAGLQKSPPQSFNHPLQLVHSPQQTKNQLKCLSTNACSLNNTKLAELSIMASELNSDIIFIAETWFHEFSHTNLLNFNLHRHDRADKHGGVGIYTNSKLNATLATSFISNNSEQLWLNINLLNDTILIGCSYRPPSSNAIALTEIINNITKAKCLLDQKKISGIIISGDFNFPSINWTDAYVNDTPSNRYAFRFFDIIQSLHLTQHVDFPTFIRADGSVLNTLDLIISDSKQRSTNIQHTHPLGHANQGHLVINWEYQISSLTSTDNIHSEKLNFKRGDYVNLAKSISKHDWAEIITNKPIDDSYSTFIDIYNKSTSTYIPLKSTKPKKFKNPWTTIELIKMCNLKKKLYCQFRASQNRNLVILHEYKLVCTQTRKLIKQCISEYELSLATDKSNPKKLFAYINSKVKSSTKISSITRDRTITTNPKTIANTLNEQFHSVFTNKSVDPLLIPFTDRTTSTLYDPTISVGLVLAHLKNLNPSKSTGSDGISPYVLNSAPDAFAPVLTFLFNESLKQGRVPSPWSEANVNAQHKSKDKLDPSNYRPISITSVPCKILEKINRDSINDYLLHNKLISPQQHGFVSNKACITNLLESNDILTKLASKGIPIDIVFLDFAKAFDKVSHPLLIYKLTKYGISGKLLNWINAFLLNRRQRVVFGDIASDWLPVLSGVPQGSVLGPTLFILFINDLTDHLHNYASLYADDTKLICGLNPYNINKCILSLQEDINKIVIWTKMWQMELNISKCKVMNIGIKNPKHTYTMNNYTDNLATPLNITTHELDLGIIISNDLKLGKQCAKAANTAYSIFGRLKRAFISKSLHIWKLLYTTYIRPHLEFAISAWNPYLKKDINLE